MRRGALLTSGLALPFVLAACGGGSGSASPAPSPTSEETSTDAPTSLPPTMPATVAAPSSAPATEAYLDVPAGVTLTAPGSTLALKQDATVAWQPRNDLVGVLDLAVARIQQTTGKAAFGGYSVDSSTKKSDVYYVKVTTTNAGSSGLGARDLPLYAVDSAGTLVQATGFGNRFEACPDAQLPFVFGPDATATSCLVFLLPAGDTLSGVEFRPPEGVQPLTWVGDVKPLSDRGDTGGQGTKGDKNGKGDKKGQDAKDGQDTKDGSS